MLTARMALCLGLAAASTKCASVVETASRTWLGMMRFFTLSTGFLPYHLPAPFRGLAGVLDIAGRGAGQVRARTLRSRWRPWRSRLGWTWTDRPGGVPSPPGLRSQVRSLWDQRVWPGSWRSTLASQPRSPFLPAQWRSSIRWLLRRASGAPPQARTHWGRRRRCCVGETSFAGPGGRGRPSAHVWMRCTALPPPRRPDLLTWPSRRWAWPQPRRSPGMCGLSTGPTLAWLPGCWTSSEQGTPPCRCR